MTTGENARNGATSISSRLLTPDAMRRLELHEARAHVHGQRTVRDLGDAILLHDPVERDPFHNRVSGVRLPAGEAALARRLAELLGLFASLGRRPHVWLSPRFHTPEDLGPRLQADGFDDLGGTYAMVLEDAAASTVVDLPPGVRLERLSTAGERHPAVVHGAAQVMVAAFDSGPNAEPQLAQDLAGKMSGEWDVCLLSVEDEPVAAGRRYTADGMTYLSSIATRPSWRGNGFGAAVTATLVNDGRLAGGEIVHLGVESRNARAQRLYRRLGFVVLGDRVADLLLG